MRSRQSHRRARERAVAAGATLSLALGLLAVPQAVGAFSSGFDSHPVSLAARGGIGSFTPASVDPRLAAKVSVNRLANSPLFKFTPALTDGRANRAVNVAVRVDSETAQAISVRQALATVADAQAGIAAVRIAPSAFNLGVARGYESFAPRLAQSITTPEIKKIDMPDLAAFAPGKGKDRLSRTEPSRFAPRVAVDEAASKAGRAPRTLEGQGDYSVDLGGSYRLTRNLNVTAGVRYSSERDRIAPLTDSTQDSQAVYIGTQFRF